jgi:lipoyl(octanoyl) transferase
MSKIEWLRLPGLTSYPASTELMLEKVCQVIRCPEQVFILLLEYPDLYTLGSSASQDDLLNIQSIPFFCTDRGGKTTYHGPGQLIIYPIIHLSYFNYDIKMYLNFLQQVLVQTFAEIGVAAFACNEKIGIWTKVGGFEQKLASIGIRVKKWAAYHGASVNIAPNMANFDKIIACGLKGGQQTSLQNLGYNTSFSDFVDAFKGKFIF